MSDDRSLEFEIEVEGTPEEIWEAIATGPGISSWYVPHTVEEREGGAATASFGDAPEMQVAGRVAAWEPPRRIVFDGGEGVPGLAFEWLVEAREGGSCVVRLVNTGFGSGEMWDAQYDGLAEGWPLFLLNLQLHLRHFRGQRATSCLPMGMRPGDRASTWTELTASLGVASPPAVGDHLELRAADDLAIVGEVVEAGPKYLALLISEPAPGTAFVAAEHAGEMTAVSIWSYLYGDGGAAAAERDRPRWQAWIDAG